MEQFYIIDSTQELNAMLSIVIPAHNEESVIAACLSRILEGSKPGELEVIVACNGCTDSTASLARRVGTAITVVETSDASKTIALNLGDSHATAYPRFYIDADIAIGVDAIRAVACVLQEGRALAAAPRMEVDLAGASWPVRAFYTVWRRLPYHRHGMIGSGVYALSQAGRGRFGAFPMIIADDGYVRALFKPDERVTLDDHCFVVKAPRRLFDLIKIKTRSRLGRYELRVKYPSLDDSAHVGWKNSFLQLAGRPSLWPSVVVYCFVVAATIYRAKRQLKTVEKYVWERDETSRVE